jgi:8-oxo-dGTP diphosphatase
VYTSEFPPFYVTVDIVVLCVDAGELKVLAIRRPDDDEHFPGAWALPGGFVDIDEDLAPAAARELEEETGFRAELEDLHQFGTYGAPDRDPRYDRVVSVGHLVVVPEALPVRGGSDAAHASWEPVAALLDGGHGAMAFDHRQILADARDRARTTLRQLAALPEHRRMAAQLLPADEFTLSELRAAYDAFLGERTDAANFQRKVKGRVVLGLERYRAGPGERGRPAELFRVMAPDEPVRLPRAEHP